MSTTQQHLLISDIKNNMLLLKNGGGALVLQVSAVNFGLLSEREQIAIIVSFAQMLNSLSFSIQIVIYSERLNISSYLSLLDKAQHAQINPLLSSMIGNYKQFIQTTIKENDVLDKKFYVVVPLFPLELGLTATKEHLEQKVKTVLLPRRDQVIRQLGRVGLKATQLTQHKLIELFYNIYNSSEARITQRSANGQFVENEVILKQPQSTTTHTTGVNQPHITNPQATETTANRTSKNHPFVVEELNENT